MGDKRELPGEFIEKLIIKGIMEDPKYNVIVSSSFIKDYFDNEIAGGIFENVSNYYKEYSKLPPKEVIIQKSKNPEEVKSLIEESNCVDFDISNNYDYLFNETNRYLKEQAIKDFMMKGVNIIDKGEDPNVLRSQIEEALCKDLKIDLGTDYWDSLGPRLKRVLSQTDIRIPSYYPCFDEFIAGGFPPYTLSVFLARIHGGKSNIMLNMASRQAFNGKNVAILTLEMSEDSNSQRLDAIHSQLDVNRIYIDKKVSGEMVKTLKGVRNHSEGLGKLLIKEFPTGNASISDFRKYLRELSHRGTKLDCIFVDYVNLMKPEYKTREGMYSDVKRISEELRALSLEFKCPIVSCSQLNREGMFTNLKELDFTYVAESIALSATSDAMFILGTNEDDWIYESEVHYKIVKNRLGGRVGEYGKFYIDKRSLKMYDSSELDQWIEDAKISGDERKINKMKK